MNEQKKRGRPPKKKESSEALTENNPQKNMQDEVESPKNNFNVDDDEDLKQFLKNKKQVSDNNTNTFSASIDDEALKEVENFEKKNNLNDIPDEDFNPLNEPVQKRSYTGGIGADPFNIQNPFQERIIEEPHYKGGNSKGIDVDKELLNPDNDIPEPNPNYQKKNTQQNSGQNKNSSDSSSKSQSEPDSDNLKNLSTKEKREAMEKTADTILLAYRNYIPLPFIFFSSYDNKKLEKLHRNDEINLDTQVKRDGTTFREYVKTFNDNVEQAFSVTDAEVEALKDPLVDVLMEKEIALTPTQRLLFTAGQLLVAKVMMSIKFLREKKSDIEEMKEIHQEKMEAIREELERNSGTNKQTSSAKNKNTPNPPEQEPNLKVVKDDEDIEADEDNSNDRDVSDAKIISEEKNVEKTEPSLSDYLERDMTAEDNDIPL